MIQIFSIKWYLLSWFHACKDVNTWGSRYKHRPGKDLGNRGDFGKFPRRNMGCTSDTERMRDKLVHSTDSKMCLKREAFVCMCWGYQIRRSDPPRLQRITVAIIGKHDDATDCRTAHNHIQSHLVDKHCPEFHRNNDRVRTKAPPREPPPVLQRLDQDRWTEATPVSSFLCHFTIMAAVLCPFLMSYLM